MLESCRGAWKGLCCAHLMGKVKLKTGLLVASGLAKRLCRALSRYAALRLGCYSCPLPRLTQFWKCDTIMQTRVKGRRIAEQITSEERR